MEIVSNEIWRYAEDHTSPESDLLREIERETHVNYLFPRMISGHFQGRLLSMFSKMIRPLNILEIGTYTGYGTICLAEGLRESGRIHTIEINMELEETINLNLQRAGIREKVILYLGNALEIIPELNLNFDIVFLDADKINYLTYYKILMDHISPGGYIFADNVLWSGKVLENKERDKEATFLQEFNEYINKDSRVEKILLPVRDGIMIIRKIA